MNCKHILDSGHPGITSENNRNTPGCIFPWFQCLFKPEKHPQCALHTHVHPCDVIAAKVMPPSGRAHPHEYTVQV